jgi:FdhD protein
MKSSAVRRDAPLAETYGSQPARGRIAGGSRQTVATDWMLAEEVPVALLYNGRSRLVMMATPTDLEDFGIGISVTEQIVGRAAEIEDLAVCELPEGFTVDMRVDPELVTRYRLRQRGITGRTGCGLCGVETLAEALKELGRIERRFDVGVCAIARALDALPGWQPMNGANRSVHAAAWCTPEGEILEAREDVGRHNALDKLIGTLLRTGRDPAEGFVVMSSRCSFELVQKAAVAGISCLATISAPTSMALSLAEATGIRLAAGAPGGIILFEDGAAVPA